MSVSRDIEKVAGASSRSLDEKDPSSNSRQGAAVENGKLPNGWRWVTLRDLAEIAGGVTKGQKRRSTETVRSVPYSRVANVQRGYLDLSEVKEIDASESEIQALRLQPGDILFNESGDRGKLGPGVGFGMKKSPSVFIRITSFVPGSAIPRTRHSPATYKSLWQRSIQQKPLLVSYWNRL